MFKETDPARRTKWRAEVTVDLPNGKSQRVTARGMTQKDALSRLLDRAAAARRANPDGQRMTVTQLLAKYREHRLPEWRGSTIMEHDRLAKRINERIGSVRLSQLAVQHIETAMRPDREAGMGRTANGVRRALKAALAQAEAWGLVSVNVARATPRATQAEPKRGMWQPVEIHAFLAAARRVLGPVSFAAIHTALFTGLREGEIVELRWVDVTPAHVQVRGTYSRGEAHGRSDGKSANAARVVPISPAVYDVIRAARRDSPSPWAFPTRNGTALGPRNLQRAFRGGIRATMDRDSRLRVVEGTGVPLIRFHDLRRIAATLWAMNGVPPKVIQRLLGHSTPRLALEVYTDVMEHQMEGVALDPLSLRTGSHIGGFRQSNVGRNGPDGPRLSEGEDAVPDEE